MNICFHIIRSLCSTLFLVKSKENNSKPNTSLNTDETDNKDRNEDETIPKKEDLLMKIKSLALIEDDDIDSDIDEEEINNFGSDVYNLCDRIFSK